ncbi:MAG TPA: CapA family protein [Burkholderiales bacterium]
MPSETRSDPELTLFLCGDVMTGRGVDQILRHPSAPHLYEPAARDAREYVHLAEAAVGQLPRRVDDRYVWGEALDALGRLRPHARVVNLETAVTVSEAAWPSKGIHYRMHPDNVGCLVVGGIDCCALANNHVLDWGHEGLCDTLSVLHAAGIRTAGAGRDAAEAAAPAVLPAGSWRVLVFAFAHASSGVPAAWAAGRNRAGIRLLHDLSARSVQTIAEAVQRHKRRGDVAIASVHWGANWGYGITPDERAFAHGLIDTARIDLIHGHSSHHVKGIEVYRDRLILYGCGDFLTDYEGIRGYEAYRGDLSFMYFPTLDAASGRLLRLRLAPIQVRRLRVNRARSRDAEWLRAVLVHEGRALGTSARFAADGLVELDWR